MSSSAQKPPRSVSSHSSHHSTIEPRGAPEFNREYARQLSLAKRSRSASKTHGRSGDTSSAVSSAAATPVARSPPPQPSVSASVTSRFKPLGSFFSSAKEMTATTPTRRTGDAAHAPAVDETPRVPMTQKPPLAPSTPSVSPRAGDAAAHPKAPPTPATPRARPSETAASSNPSLVQDGGDDGSDVSLVRIVQVVFLVWGVLFLVFCGIALFASADAAYRPHYFSFYSVPANQSTAPLGYKAHGIDRVVPQVCRQLALRLRNCGRLVGSAFMSGGQLQVLGMVLSDVADGVLLALRSVNNRIIAPLSRFVTQQSARVWSLVRSPFSGIGGGGANSTVFNFSGLLQPVSQATNFMIVDPSRAVYDTTVSFFVAGADSLRYAYHIFLSDDYAHHRAASTPASKNPLHRPVRGFLTGLKATGKRLLGHGVNTTRSAAGRSKGALSRWFSNNASANRVNMSAAVPVTFSFSAHYTHRLEGDLWRDILADSLSEVKELVTQEVAAALGLQNHAAVGQVRLRAGSLIIDVDVTQEATATPTRPDKNGGNLSKKERRTAQKSVDDKAKSALRQWPFTSVKAFYEARASDIATRQAEQQRLQAAKVAESQAKFADDCACLRTATAASVKHCKPPPPHLADLCEDLVDRATTSVQRQLANEVASHKTQREKDARQALSEQERAVAAVKSECAEALQNARTSAEAADKASRSALQECQHTAKQRQEACDKEVEKVRRDGASTVADLAKAKKACADDAASEVARCGVALEKAKKECAVAQAAAVQTVQERCDKQRAEEAAAGVAQCRESSERELQTARNKAQQDCEQRLTAQAAAAASAPRSVDEACVRAQQQVVALQAKVSDCTRESADAESRLASESAAWQAEKAAAVQAVQEQCRETSERELQTARNKAQKDCEQQVSAMETKVSDCMRETADAESRLVSASTAWQAEKAAAVQAVQEQCDKQRAEEAAAGVAQCRESSERELQTARNKAQQDCEQRLTAQAAAAASAPRSVDEACVRAQQQVVALQAKVSDCTRESADAESRLASESAAWQAEKATLEATAEAREATLQREAELSLRAVEAQARRDCDAHTETAVVAAVQKYREDNGGSCDEQLHRLRSSLETSCAVSTAEALHREQSAHSDRVKEQLAQQRAALTEENAKHAGLAYLTSCEKACTHIMERGGVSKCTEAMKSLRATLNTARGPLATPAPLALNASVSSFSSTHTPVCGLAWSDAVQPRGSAPKVRGMTWRQLSLLTIATAAGYGLAFFAVRVALKQHRSAVFLREEVRKLQKQVVSLEQEQTRQHIASSSSTSRTESPQRTPRDRSFASPARSLAGEVHTWEAPLAGLLQDHFTAMSEWHFTCCNLLWVDASASVGAAAAVVQDPADVAVDRDSHPPTPRDETAPSTPTQAHLTGPSDGGPLAQLNATLERRVVRAYYYMLESYYVDLLESVTNRELIEHQLEEMEDVASKQMALLQTQSGAVTRLQDEVSHSMDELATVRKQHQAECAAYQRQIAKQKAAPAKEMDCLRAELEKAQQEARQATQMRNLQAEMVAVLEEQLGRVTAALQETQNVPASAASAQSLVQPTQAPTARRSSGTPRMTRGSETRRDYRELDWHDDAGDTEL